MSKTMTVKQMASLGGKARAALPNIGEIRSAAMVKRGETMRRPDYKRPGKGRAAKLKQ